MIKGYFLLSRKIFDSAIWADDPHILKLFIYLIGRARFDHKTKQYPGFKIKRGELVTSLSHIADDNEFNYRNAIRRWSRPKVSRMLLTLEEQGYIKLVSDTYGTHISICNYSEYQDSNNYVSDSCVTDVKQLCNGSETVVSIIKNGNKDKNVKNDKKKEVNLVAKGLATLLADKVLINDSGNRMLNNGKREATILRWAKDIDMIMRLDKRPESEVELVINWCQQDSFWKGNILSGKKLREKFDMLRGKALQPSKGSDNKYSAGAEEWLKQKQREAQSEIN